MELVLPGTLLFQTTKEPFNQAVLLLRCAGIYVISITQRWSLYSILPLELLALGLAVLTRLKTSQPFLKQALDGISAHGVTIVKTQYSPQ